MGLAELVELWSWNMSVLLKGGPADGKLGSVAGARFSGPKGPFSSILGRFLFRFLAAILGNFH